MIGALPESLIINENEYPIRSDYRNVLDIFEMFSDVDIEPSDRYMIAIYMMYEDFASAEDVEKAAANGFDVEEAYRQLLWFISCGKPKDKGKKIERPVYDWNKDEQMIFSAVNKAAGKEVRSALYMHWWTFMGYFNEIGEGLFSYITSIRNKINNNKKLDKDEYEFCKKNKDLIEIKPPKTAEEQQQENEYQALLDEVLG